MYAVLCLMFNTCNYSCNNQTIPRPPHVIVASSSILMNIICLPPVPLNKIISFAPFNNVHYDDIRSTLSNWIIELPRITTVPIFSVVPPPLVDSDTASSNTTFRNASYPRSCPVTLRLPLSDNFNLLSCVISGVFCFVCFCFVYLLCAC